MIEVQVRVIRYEARGGWSAELPRELDSPQTLVLVFFAPRYIDAPAPVHAVAEAFPSSIVGGCSTGGEIVAGEVFDDSIVVTVVRFDSVTPSRACVPIHGDAASLGAGHELGQELRKDQLRAVLVLSHGVNVNGTGLVRGLRESLPASVQIAGGMAADGPRFRRTVVFDGRAGVLGERALAIGFHGDRLRVGCASRGGWDVFGLERRITRSEGNIVLELDGRPALDLYRQYLGDRAEDPAAALLFPLAIRAGREDSRLVRSVLAVDEERRALRFAAEMPEGWLAQLMRANSDRLILGAMEAAEEAADSTEVAPVLAIAISCVGRRMVLGERTEEEVEGTHEALPAGSVQVGFYSGGEIGRQGQGRCEFHNQTMTVVTLSEA